MRQESGEAKDADPEIGDFGASTGIGFGATNLAQANRDLIFFC
jgi:hypothetical protein